MLTLRNTLITRSSTLLHTILKSNASITDLASRSFGNLMAEAEPNPSVKSKRTFLYDFHVQNGGKIVDCAGWLMPEQYTGLSPLDSHLHTRHHCSLFDVSHMMQTRVHGRDRFKFIESLVVSDVAGLRADTGCLTVFTNDRGGIIDDLIVSNTALGHLYLVSNAGCADKDYAHLKAREQLMRGQKMDVTVERVDDMALLAVQGPRTAEILQTGVKFDLEKLPYMSSIEAEVFGVGNCRVTRCGYTGEDGVEISVPKNRAVQLAEQILDYKKGTVCKLAGLNARDTLRLEAGLCLYGNELDETRTPIEAGLAWLVGKRRREERNFPGAHVIMRQLSEKNMIKRVGLTLISSMCPPAQSNSKIYDSLGLEIGRVTSGCYSPSLRQNIAMGYVHTMFGQPDTRLVVDIRGKQYEAEVVKMPFRPVRHFKLTTKRAGGV